MSAFAGSVVSTKRIPSLHASTCDVASEDDRGGRVEERRHRLGDTPSLVSHAWFDPPVRLRLNTLRERSVQHLTHARRECFRRDRLLEVRDVRFEYAMADDAVVGVARHTEHFHVGSNTRKSLREFGAAHLRHHDVAQEQMDRGRVLLGMGAAPLRRREAVEFCVAAGL